MASMAGGAQYQGHFAMKIRLTFGAAAAAALIATGASAGEWADQCVERLEADGRDSSGCACLEAEIEANPSLVDEFLALGEIEDPAERFETASPEAQAAMQNCTR